MRAKLPGQPARLAQRVRLDPGPLLTHRHRVDVVGLVAFALVFSTFFSRFDLIGALVYFCASLLLGFHSLAARRFDKLFGLIALNIGLWAIEGFYVGTLPPGGDFVTFLGSEGRVLLAYVPLAFFLVAPVHTLTAKHVLTTFRAVAIAFSLMVAIWLIASPSILSDRTIAGTRHFWGFTSSHHIPGLLASVAALVLFSAYIQRRRWLDLVLTIGCVLTVLASGSRTSLFALSIATALMVLTESDTSLRRRSIIVGMVTILMIPFIAPQVVETVSSLTSERFLDEAVDAFNARDGKQVIDSSTSVGGANILLRVGIWGAAVDAFALSPIIGIGTWRLNDSAKRYIGWPGVVYLAMEGEDNLSDFGAHSVPLQMLSENGLLGLVLLVWLWMLLGRRLRSGHRTTPESHPYKWLSRAAFSVYVFCLATIVASTAILVPALMGEASVVIGVALMAGRTPSQAPGASLIQRL